MARASPLSQSLMTSKPICSVPFSRDYVSFSHSEPNSLPLISVSFMAWANSQSNGVTTPPAT